MKKMIIWMTALGLSVGSVIGQEHLMPDTKITNLQVRVQQEINKLLFKN
ncbi:MAG: hypothetical protein IPO39_15495 [Bacteroidetes bacterium]|nr:hypothetical protein [Bacteroidota bacterium]